MNRLFFNEYGTFILFKMVYIYLFVYPIYKRESKLLGLRYIGNPNFDRNGEPLW